MGMEGPGLLINLLRELSSGLLAGSALGVLQASRIEWNTHNLVYKPQKTK